MGESSLAHKTATSDGLAALEKMKQRLQEAISSKNAVEITATLKDLSVMPIKIADLRETKMGAVLQDIKKDYPQADVIRKQWKTIFTKAQPSASSRAKPTQKLLDRRAKAKVEKEKARRRPGYDDDGNFVIPAMLKHDADDGPQQTVKKKVIIVLLMNKWQSKNEIYHALQIEGGALRAEFGDRGKVKSRADVSNLLHQMLIKTQILKNKQEPPQYMVAPIWASNKLRMNMNETGNTGKDRLHDPNEPVKPLNGYFQWSDTMRATVVQMLEQESGGRFEGAGKVANKEVQVRLAEIWAEQPEDVKTRWKAKSDGDFTEYRKAMREYKKSHLFRDWIQHLRTKDPHAAIKLLTKRERKDENAPKRPMSSYFRFMTDKRKEMIAAGKEDEIRNVAVFGKEVAKLWRDVSVETKAEMQIQYQKEVAEYEKKWNEYKKSEEYKNYHSSLLTKIDEALAKQAVKSAKKEGANEEPGAPKQKPPKDTNAPSKPLIAFFAFGADYRSRKWEDQEKEFIAAAKARGEEPGIFKKNIGEMSKEIGFAWGRLTDPQKEVWKSVARMDKERYDAEMVEYRETENYAKYQAFIERCNKEGDFRTDDQRARDARIAASKEKKAEHAEKRKADLELRAERKKLKLLETADRRAGQMLKKDAIEDKPSQFVVDAVETAILNIMGEGKTPTNNSIRSELEDIWSTPPGELDGMRQLINAAIRVVYENDEFQSKAAAVAGEAPIAPEKSSASEGLVEPQDDFDEMDIDFDMDQFGLGEADLEGMLALGDDGQATSAPAASSPKPRTKSRSPKRASPKTSPKMAPQDEDFGEFNEDVPEEDAEDVF